MRSDKYSKVEAVKGTLSRTLTSKPSWVSLHDRMRIAGWVRSNIEATTNANMYQKKSQQMWKTVWKPFGL